MLCPFDVSDDFTGDQFRLSFMMDPAQPGWFLNSSNPGQFYYNVFFFGVPGDLVTLNIQIPHPFITKGAVPIQAHDGSSLTTIDGQECFVPGENVAATIVTEGGNLSPSGHPVILLSDYGASPVVGVTSTMVTVTGTVPASGELYVTIHLDYGLKKTAGWAKVDADGDTESDDACSSGSILPCTGVTILHPQSYTFSFSENGSLIDEQTPQSINRFKKDPGFAGVVTRATALGEEPVQGVKVNIYRPTGALLGTVFTDEDGVYLFPYKHTGKAAYYTIKLPDYGKQVKVLVKSNGWAIVNFTIP